MTSISHQGKKMTLVDNQKCKSRKQGKKVTDNQISSSWILKKHGTFTSEHGDMMISKHWKFSSKLGKMILKHQKIWKMQQQQQQQHMPSSKHGNMTTSVLMEKNRKMQQQPSKTTIYELPEDALTQILKRLPVKYLLRCRCVLKSWYHLIKTPVFITLHLNYQKKLYITTSTTNEYEYDHPPPQYLLFRGLYAPLLSVGYDDIQCEEYCNIEYLSFFPESFTWLAHSFGLLCVSSILSEPRNYSPGIYLWNPLLQKCKTLPVSPLSGLEFGYEGKALAFGFLPEVNDYVVIHIVIPRTRYATKPHSVIIGVYSLNTNSWKIITQHNVFITSIVKKDVTFVNGVAFWVGVHSRSHPVVMCFDTKTDMLREISLPDWIHNLGQQFVNPTLHPFGQSIAYFVQNSKTHHLDMWVLKGDPMNDFSWENKLSVTLSSSPRIEVLGLRNNGDPIFFNFSDFISYSLDEHEEYDFVYAWHEWDDGFSDYDGYFPPPVSIRPFVESLALLDIDCNN